MNNREMIRYARKKLGLNQSDMANINISRNLISDIENGNTKLVPSKALLIYKKLIIESYSRGIQIDINFDEILNENIEYVHIKQASDIIDELKKLKDNTSSVKQFELENYRLVAIRNNIGILRYYLLRALAELSEDDDKFKIKVLFNTLEYLKWEKYENIYEKYDSTLKEVSQIAYKSRMIKELRHFYEFQREKLIEIGKVVGPRVYYNLSLLEENLEAFEISYSYIEKYLEYRTLISSADYYDALITKARLSTKSGNYEKGMILYEEILLVLSFDEHKKQISIVLSNILYNLPKLIRKLSDDKVEKYINQLIEMIPEVLHLRNFPAKLYLNIAIGFTYTNKNVDALVYLKKALDTSKSDSTTAIIIRDTFKYIQDTPLELLVVSISKIVFTELKEKEKNDFMLSLLKIQAKAFRENDVACCQVLNEYINKL